MPEPEFAHHRHRIALADFEADVVDDSGLAWIIGADPVDGEDRRRIAGGAFDEPVAGDALAHQAARIFLLRLLQDLPGVAELDDLAALEHHDAIGDLRDDREVVGYVQRRRAVLANEFAKRGEALDLRRHVERGGRLVEDQNVGLGDHRHRRHHALQLPAGDLMGIARADRLRARQIELPEKVDRLGARRLRRQHAVADRGFAHLLHQRVRRIERGGGALRDIGDLGPAQRAPLVGADRADVLVAEDDGAANDIAVAAGVAHRGQADRRLAGAEFADQADHLAALQGQRNVLDQHGALGGVGPHRDTHRANVENDRIVTRARLVLHALAHAPSPWPLEWIASIQSTTKLTPMVNAAIAPAG